MDYLWDIRHLYWKSVQRQNEVVVGTNEESMSRYVRANHVNFMSVADIDGKKKRAWGKIRYNHKGAWCTVERTGEDEIFMYI